MSLALARKYRPTTFDDLVGQDAVSQTLSLALDGDRLSHAYLFSGLRGSGKTSTARIFSKALLCEVGASSHPCGECSHCIMAAENRHMDIIEMDAASNRGIDDIKELIEHTKYKPSAGRYKIFIIDEVHMLTTQAFNALLKTLEEPPDFVKFILATTDPLKLPATILSRTQHFRFKKIKHKLVLSHLEHILNLEKVEYEKEALDIIARSGAGSLRDSLTLLDQAIVYSRNHVNVATVTGMLGIIEPSLLDTLLSDLLNKDEEKILAFITLASEYEAEMIIDELTLYLKELLFAKDSRFPPLIIDRFFRTLAEAKELLGLGSDGEFVLSLTLFKMQESLSVRDIDEMIRTLQKELSGVQISGREKEIDLSGIVPNVTKQIDKDIAAKQPDKLPEPEVTIDTTQIMDKPPVPSRQEEKAETAQGEQKLDNATRHHSEDPVANREKVISEASPIDSGALKFKTLQQKIYDRDYDLGSCFERNIAYESYSDGALTWHSSAQEDDKKTLINHWGIIRMFVQDVYGVETKIINIPTEANKGKKKVTVTSPTTSTVNKKYHSVPKSETTHQDADSGSMIEDIELKNSCIAPDAGETEAAKEKDPSELLKEPMIKEMIALFDPKKVTIRKKS